MAKTIQDFATKMVSDFFDRLKPTIIGPFKTKVDDNNKTIIFSSASSYIEEPNIQKLFLENLNKKIYELTPNEKQILNEILESANYYIEKLKNSTNEKILLKINDLVLKSKFTNETMNKDRVVNIVSEELDKALSHFIKIAEAEGTKAKNMGSLVKIANVGVTMGIDDPTVFFVTSRDNKVCEECLRLHVMPDKITPRVWKVSELKFTYHKKGEPTPSVNGLHPHCRCTLTLLSPGFGFDNKGLLKFISMDHDEYKRQRGL